MIVPNVTWKRAANLRNLTQIAFELSSASQGRGVEKKRASKLREEIDETKEQSTKNRYDRRIRLTLVSSTCGPDHPASWEVSKLQAPVVEAEVEKYSQERDRQRFRKFDNFDVVTSIPIPTCTRTLSGILRGTFKLCRSSPYVHQSEENGYRMNRIRVRNSQSRLPARCLEDGLSLVPSIQSAHGIALISMSWTGEPCCLSSSPSFSSNRGPSQTNFPLPFPPILCQL